MTTTPSTSRTPQRGTGRGIGIRTAAGTVTRSTITRFWTSDWESMYQFIRDRDAPFLLEQRIHNGNMRQFLEDNPEDLPIGLNADTKYVVRVRKPTGK